jgi:hypothetical protein
LTTRRRVGRGVRRKIPTKSLRYYTQNREGREEALRFLRKFLASVLRKSVDDSAARTVDRREVALFCGGARFRRRPAVKDVFTAPIFLDEN